MEKLDQIVEEYLKVNTNHALLLTGSWGTGKTFYYKNNLVEIIKNTPTIDDASILYQPIRISLFGINSLDELQSEIFFALYDFLKDKKLKLGGAIGKLIIKGILIYKGYGFLSDFLSSMEDLKVDKKNWIPYNSLVICFDDLERISIDLNIEELIGFINSLLEDNPIKVLIIANEDKIEQEQFKCIKEKIIGVTIEFRPNIENICLSIIKNKYFGFPTYSSFLQEHQSLILQIIKKDENNLRTLIFGLNSFMRIYSEIELNSTTSEFIKKSKKEILTRALQFTLSISIPYRKGKISYSNKRLLDFYSTGNTLKLPSLEQLFSPPNEVLSNQDNLFKDGFIKEFYSDGNYFFFNSIFNHITGGSLFIFSEFEIEVKDLYQLKEDAILPQYRITNKLTYPSYLSLENKEYISLVRELLTYSDKGDYLLLDYLAIFRLSIQLGNPLKYDPDKLATRIVKGIEKAKHKVSAKENIKSFPIPIESFIDIQSDDIHRIQLLKIKNAIIHANNEIKLKLKQEDYLRMEKLFYSDYNNFLSNAKEKYALSPILKDFNINNFYSRILSLSNKQLHDLIFFFKDRYNDLYIELNHELSFLEKLNKKIKVKVNSKPPVITGHLFKLFHEILNKSIEKMKNKINQ
ncbi:MAG: hypothetical protein J7604_25955 [Sporocytophaga sp.]|uniref:P-loop NTPase fold protein n=1 Tax=Sporocytophaga sp. TaxID=2231183 RepID=UPI001B039425|nr:P-loop NTPase fold protein [Sporocytophaga sp.]MBO9703676.1 hypothetical protein [Sporocytophaga sp.]